MTNKVYLGIHLLVKQWYKENNSKLLIVTVIVVTVSKLGQWKLGTNWQYVNRMENSIILKSEFSKLMNQTCIFQIHSVLLFVLVQ